MPPDIPESQSPRPSLRDIAKLLGLSHVAVSLALRDSPRISRDTRGKVRAAAEKLGYRPDPMLASLAAYRQGKRCAGIRASLGWINQWDDPEALRRHREFDLYWQGAREVAERLGYHLEEFRWPPGKPCRRLQTILETRGVRGLLIPPHRSGPLLAEFDLERFSVVRFGASVAALPAHAVTSDQSHCARLAYEKALERGYSRIGYVSGVDFERSTRGHFCEGFLNSQRELSPAGSRLPPLILPADARRREAVLKSWLRAKRPDAVLNTEPCLRALLAGLRVRVPEDVAVAETSVQDGGFDAGVDQNSREIGRMAAGVLAALILGGECGLPRVQRRTLVQGEWVDGRSFPFRAGGGAGGRRSGRRLKR